ncbi:uncharacterized protein AB675_1190 [Cyphellophora attinorum]|uniref:Uncharacterized protein n=1 Tax=Cyphellophora attinorum TaxID=1664694 RepID=A0A0N1H1D1_9EURO|nr:uncharacterized protein AB675_1190 [Phialophora attinorum]KPI38122.1 hypothetical protein AB675_1190 [Phialophora attinorum]
MPARFGLLQSNSGLFVTGWQSAIGNTGRHGYGRVHAERPNKVQVQAISFASPTPVAPRAKRKNQIPTTYSE